MQKISNFNTQHTKSAMNARVAKNVAQEILRTIRYDIEEFAKKKFDYIGKNVLIVIGNTRCGKSTFTNYLAGVKLRSVQVMEEFMEKYNITLAEDHHKSAEIGHKPESCTTMPKIYASNRIDIDIWDTPGFGDARSIKQDICNAYFISELLNKTQSFKIILLADFSTIHNNYLRPFCSLLKKVMTIFPDHEKLFKSTAMIFTKVPREVFEKTEDWTKTHPDKPLDPIRLISNILKKSSIGFKLKGWLGDKTMEAKKFVDNLIKNNQQIGIFKKVHRVKCLLEDSDLNYEIFKAINSTVALTIDNRDSIPIGIADDSLVFLKQSYNKLRKLRNCGEKAIIEEYATAIKAYKKWLASQPEECSVKSLTCKAMTQVIELLPIIDNGCLDMIKHIAHMSPELMSKVNLSNIEVQYNLLNFFHPILKRAGIKNIHKDALDIAIINLAIKVAMQVTTLVMDIQKQAHILTEKAQMKFAKCNSTIAESLAVAENHIASIDNDIATKNATSSSIIDTLKAILHAVKKMVTPIIPGIIPGARQHPNKAIKEQVNKLTNMRIDIKEKANNTRDRQHEISMTTLCSAMSKDLITTTDISMQNIKNVLKEKLREILTVLHISYHSRLADK